MLRLVTTIYECRPHAKHKIMRYCTIACNNGKKSGNGQQ